MFLTTIMQLFAHSQVLSPIQRPQHNFKGRIRGRGGSSAVYSLARPTPASPLPKPTLDDGSVDLVLSSGFLAFASHGGFLKAVEASPLKVRGICGTSAGALSGSLYAAGYSADRVVAELSAVPPFQLLDPNCRFWEGALMYDRVIARLRDLLPPRFEDLEMDFGVGVINGDGEHVIIDRGPLPEAVAASAAIPFLFKPVPIPGRADGPFQDGGTTDRVCLRPWRRRLVQKYGITLAAANQRPCLVHVISRSSPFSGDDAIGGEPAAYVVRSPKSGVYLWNLGDTDSYVLESYRRALPVANAVAERLSREEAGVGAAAPVPAAVAGGQVGDLLL